jgi:penicillin-binding protein 1A
MAIKKITIRYKTAIRTLLTIKRNFGKFFYGMGAVGLFFLFCFMGTFGSMPSFEDLENPDSNFARNHFGRWCGFRKVFRKTGLNYTMLIYQNLVQALIATEDARFMSILVLMAEEL